MDVVRAKPTGGETSLAPRQRMVALRAQGWSYAAIAAELACSPWTVGRWVRAHAAGGPAAPAYHGRRPRTPHPQTTPPALQARIRAIRQAHPGWGARLIRRQLDLDGVARLPSEATIQAWLRRWGRPLVRPRRHEPLGWTGDPVTAAAPVWQTGFTQKGGGGT
jgi:transposase